jgi:hypothetical protein
MTLFCPTCHGSVVPTAPENPPSSCPAWCLARHTDDDPVDLHVSSWLRYVPLPTAEPVLAGQPRTTHVRNLMVYVEQHTSADEPCVVLAEEHQGQQELRLSAEEACQLGFALLHGMSIITDEMASADTPHRAVTREG